MEIPGMGIRILCLLLIHSLLLTLGLALLGGNETDRQSLLALKVKITNYPMGILSSWNESTHFCHWPGVTCGRRHQRVTILDLQSENLVGTLSPHVGNLSFLRILNLQNNSFNQNIPPELGGLFRLKALALQNNSFGGEIPSNISHCASLLVLGLSWNDLTGKVPTELGLLSKLQELRLYRNNLVGEIPPSLGNLSSLQYISATRNNLHGSIPSTFGQLKKLKLVLLGGNQLSGTIPPLIFNLSSITTLSVEVNQLHGRLPPDLGLTLPKLEDLLIHTNQFSGLIPHTISNITNLLRISILSNNFTGKVPNLAGLHNLRMVAISENNLGNGDDDDLNFLSYLRNCTSLEGLGLNDNNFGGVLPEFISNFSTKLRFIGLGRNQIRGSIPTGIGNLISMGVLSMETNQLSGSLPWEVGKLVNLGILDISENNLSGELPESLGSCKSLESLFMQGNFLQGVIPPSLNTLRGLKSLDLSRNKLSGQIPKYLEGLALQNLNLSFNDFEGNVPVRGVFKNVSAISITGNRKLCGGIPQLNLSTCPTNESKKQRSSFKVKLIISLASGLLGLILMLSFLILYWLRKSRRVPSSSSPMINSALKVSYADLLKATNGFSSANLIGIGSFGSVYRGILHQDETFVAVKVLNLQRKGASKSFMAECEALRNVRHRNLVKILTACSSVDFQGNDFKALVYEFMVNGSLEDWLHPTHKENEAQEKRHLNFLQRINIAIDVANALDYLHHYCKVPIVHCDLKPSNILLNNDMTAHIGDFGLTRFYVEASRQLSSNQSSSRGIKGSFGYAAPGVFCEGMG